jgi:urease accessory protein
MLAAAFFLGVGTASAHDLMGGSAALTFAGALFSGVGHPIISPDYLAFLLALGIAVGVFRLSFINPLLFVVAMICGVAMHVGEPHTHCIHALDTSPK